MPHKPLIALVGALAAAAVVATASRNLSLLFGWVVLPADGAGAKLAFAARWQVLPGLALLGGVAGVSIRRAFSADAIDGARTPALEINLRYNLNTLEQLALAAVAWAGLAVSLPRHQLLVIPAMAAAFVAGRAAFLVGYLIAPVGRAFGMVLTALPTIIAFVWLIGRLLGR